MSTHQILNFIKIKMAASEIKDAAPQCNECLKIKWNITSTYHDWGAWGSVVVKALRTVPGSIPGGVTWDFFCGSFRQNHMPWGRLSLWKWVPRISPGVKAAGAFGWWPTTLVVLKVEKIQGLNLPGTPTATSACCRIPLLFTYFYIPWLYVLLYRLHGLLSSFLHIWHLAGNFGHHNYLVASRSSTASWQHHAWPSTYCTLATCPPFHILPICTWQLLGFYWILPVSVPEGTWSSKLFAWYVVEVNVKFNHRIIIGSFII